MKGIILAGGKGTRLYPMTKSVCKPLLAVYDKPLIYYSVNILLQAGIRDILIIVPPYETPAFSGLLGDGSEFGIRITYIEQMVQRGIADAFILGEEFLNGDSVCMVLGDNIFWSEDFSGKLESAREMLSGAVIFGYYVDDPRPFGVVEFDGDGNAVSIEEKPQFPKSNYIVPGLYFYDNSVVEIAKNLKPSARGELEISDVNAEYLRRKDIKVLPLGKELFWADAGNADALLEASARIKELQKQTGISIGCIEETAYRKGFITKEELKAAGEAIKMTQYGQYLLRLQ